ncbi:MAG TPA: hypothetical protein ENH25_09210 [candidate division Zixibacteria bacterium]|nr:hypothetical protein [candidate division Zixibacteria bacterium]
MKKHFILIISLLFMAALISGCYTKIAHPGEESGYIESDDDNYNENYGYTHYYYPDYWIVHNNWGHYYASPWWWDYYDDGRYNYYDDDNDGSPRGVPGQATRPDSRWEGTSGLDGANQITPGGGSSGGSSAGKKTSTDTDSKPETRTKGDQSQNSDKKSDDNTKPKSRFKTK